ncbi:MAG TPA: FKBP-type peptidyl-prolyl cis-trans isomerase [Myxococcota bacterium]|jgi:FKBP-type peptidyl-prolyl cis-trans isomerase
MARTRAATALLLTAALAAGLHAAAGEIESERDQTLYAIGARLGRSLAPFALSEAELEMVLRGLRDAVLGRELAVNETAQQDRIDALLGQRRSVSLAAEREASAALLARAAQEPGAERTPSGLVLLTLREGSGRSPAPSDRVQIHYHGRLRDGNVFDSSVERGAPVEVAIPRALPCWREALLRMRVGGKSRATCPAELAHGAKGDPPRVAGDAAVVYEIELLAIVEP